MPFLLTVPLFFQFQAKTFGIFFFFNLFLHPIYQWIIYTSFVVLLLLVLIIFMQGWNRLLNHPVTSFSSFFFLWITMNILFRIIQTSVPSQNSFISVFWPLMKCCLFPILTQILYTSNALFQTYGKMQFPSLAILSLSNLFKVVVKYA